MLCELLLVQCYNTTLVKIMQREQIDLVCETLDTMAEVLQVGAVGPVLI